MILLFEIIHAGVLGVVFFYLLCKSRNTMLFNQNGWLLFLTGFGLLFMGAVFDIADEFAELAYINIFGQTWLQALLEKILGYTLGGVLIFWGSVRIVPIILETFLIKEELKKSNEELESKVKERTLELEKANSVKSEFISMMSHEIRTPLNAIKGMTYHLRSSKLNNNQKERIKNIDSSADLLLSMFNNILYYSETESGKIKISEIGFSIKDIMLQIFNNYKGVALEKNLQFVVKSETEIADIIIGDPEILLRIVMIFIENGIKYTEKGKIEIICNTVTDNKENHKIIVTVMDTGIGISEEKIGIITRSFTQSEELATRKFGGIGLGLAIVGRLSEISKGELYVKSQRHKGSQFTVSLPCGIDNNSCSTFYFDNSEDLNNQSANSKQNSIDKDNLEKIYIKLSKLENLLKEYDSEALNLLDEIISDFGVENKFKKLKQAIRNYNYEEALENLKNLILD